MQRHWLLLSLASVALAACSAHPLPEDVTRKSTFAIVQQLRCEARAGIIEANLSEQDLNSTYIGFDFTFLITEKNQATSGSIGFTNILSDGKFLLNFKGGDDRLRSAERFFRVVQLFKDLRDDKTCTSDGAMHANLVYPITGKVGLSEVVGTYTQLRRITGLRKKEKEKSVFSDELIFITTFNAGITPSIELSAAAGRFKLTKASIDGNAERKDNHKVTIAIASKTDVNDVVRMGRALTRAGPSPGLGTDAAGVIQELDRLRNRNDDARTLDALRGLQP
jgi:hypothetical protein